MIRILILAAVVLFLVLWVRAVVDVVRRRDLSVGGKAAWAIAMLLIPFIGLLVYTLPPAGRQPDRATGAALTSAGVRDEIEERLSRRHGGACGVLVRELQRPREKRLVARERIRRDRVRRPDGRSAEEPGVPRRGGVGRQAQEQRHAVARVANARSARPSTA